MTNNETLTALVGDVQSCSDELRAVTQRTADAYDAFQLLQVQEQDATVQLNAARLALMDYIEDQSPGTVPTVVQDTITDFSG